MSRDKRPSLTSCDIDRMRTGDTAAASAAPSPSLPAVDMGRLLGDVSRAFNPLGRDFELQVQARQINADRVMVSVVLPQGMTRAFVGLLESLTGLVRFVDHRARCSAAEVKSIDPEEILGRRQHHDDFRERVCSLFDELTASGLDRKEAAKRVNRALKAENHPWATVDLVNDVLRNAGRFRKRQAGNK